MEWRDDWLSYFQEWDTLERCNISWIKFEIRKATRDKRKVNKLTSKKPIGDWCHGNCTTQVGPLMTNEWCGNECTVRPAEDCSSFGIHVMKVCLQEINHMEVILNLDHSKFAPGFLEVLVSRIPRPTDIDTCVNEVSFGCQVKSPINAQFGGYWLRSRFWCSVTQQRVMRLVNLRLLCWLGMDRGTNNMEEKQQERSRERKKEILVVRSFQEKDWKWFLEALPFMLPEEKKDQEEGGRKEGKRGLE